MGGILSFATNLNEMGLLQIGKDGQENTEGQAVDENQNPRLQTSWQRR